MFDFFFFFCFSTFLYINKNAMEMLCTFKNFIIKCLLVAVMELMTATLISFNWSFNKFSYSNSAIVPLAFLEVCLRCNARCFSSSLDIVGAMFLYVLSFVLFHLLCHLLRVIFLFSVFISDDQTM